MSSYPKTDRGAEDIVLALNDATVAHAFARILETHVGHARVVGSLLEALESTTSGVLVAEFGDLDSSAAIDGLELLEDLHALGLHPPTVLVATRPSSAQYRRAFQLGVSDVLQRPLLPDELIRAIGSAASVDAGLPADALEIGFGPWDDDIPELREGAAPEALHAVLAAERGAAEAAARDVIGWCARCEVTPPARARVGSSIAEIVQNSIEHGATTVEVSASLSARTLRIQIVDDGPGFDVAQALAAHALDSSSGLGRAHSLAEDVRIRSEAGRGTSVELSFRVTTVEFADEARIDLSDLDYFAPATSRELLATLADDPHAPIILSPALAVVVGRLLVGPDSHRILQGALRS